MNFLDAFVDEKIRKYYLTIIRIDESNKNYINKNVKYANIRDKIRIFKIVIHTKKKTGMDYSDDEKRLNELIIESKKYRS
jgi:hypothetical protein